MLEDMNRRSFLKRTVAASAGASLGLSLEEKILLAQQEKGKKAPTVKSTKGPAKDMPVGKIGDVKISRLFCGGNLIGGWAHARDLIYVSELLKAYNTDEKVMETLQLAEENGVNTILVNPVSLKVINRYRKERGGRIQVICECHPEPDKDVRTTVRIAIDSGAVLVYIQGAYGDRLVKDGRFDVIAETIEFIKEAGVPAGIGAHSLEVPKACEELELEPDFYVKTLHHDKYWSATPKENRREFEIDVKFYEEHSRYHDNMWCIKPEETIEFMKKVDKPWIAFKVLAAGAIHPREGFKFAFENGADFICVGMFDFQIREDVAITKRILSELSKTGRVRPWKG